MAHVTLLQRGPTVDSYVPRVEHESSTPDTFFGTREVLYDLVDDCSIYLCKTDVNSDSPWLDFLNNASAETSSARSNPGIIEIPDASEWLVLHNARVFVGSRAPSGHSLSNGASDKAISITYPSISIHATRHFDVKDDLQADQPQAHSKLFAVYMQIEMYDGPEREDQTGDMVEVLLVPASQTKSSSVDENLENNSNKAQVDSLYEALCKCADLNPDLDLDQADDEPSRYGDLGTSWITAENVDQFNFDSHASMPPEASPQVTGTRRAWNEEEDAENVGAQKWQRTE